MTDYITIAGYVLCILIVILILLSYFLHGGKVRQYLIEANNLPVSKFYFRLLVFSFGVLTFLFGIHDNLLNSREREDNYAITLPPLMDNENLARESTFSEGGYLPPLKIDKHSYNRIDYLIILDRTKSINTHIDKKISLYCQEKLKTYPDALEAFQKLKNGPDKILAALVHRISLINDIDTIRLNIQVYNGNDIFHSLLGANWETLQIGVTKEKERVEQIKNILERLKGIDESDEDSKTYFHEIYQNITYNTNVDTYQTKNTSVIVLSDFVHEFEEDGKYAKEQLRNDIEKLDLDSCKKLTLVGLPLYSNQNTVAINNSVGGIELLKAKKPSATRLYAWSYYDLKEFEDDKLSAFFKSVLSIPPSTISLTTYDRDKITVESLKKDFGTCNYFGCEIKTGRDNTSVLSKFSTIKITDIDELKSKLVSTNEKQVVNLIFDTLNNSKEGIVEFIPSQSIPKRSIRLFFFIRFLFLTTILWINFIYLWYRKQSNLEDNLVYTIKIGVISAIVLIIGLIAINFFATLGVFNLIEWFYVLIMIIMLNIAPFLFYRFDKPL